MRQIAAFGFMISVALFGISKTCEAGISLTGAVVEGTSSAGNYLAQYDWHTANLPSGAYQLWVIQGSNLNGSFINGPGASQSGINASLALGANTFTVYGSSNLPDTAFYGLELAFNGVNIPVISAFAALQTSTSSIPPFMVDPSSSTIRWDDSTQASPGALSFQSGGELVTLTSFYYAGVNVYSKDRVSPHSTTPDGSLDNLGQFTLTVTPSVPEPSSLILVSMPAMIGVGFALRRRRSVTT